MAKVAQIQLEGLGLSLAASSSAICAAMDSDWSGSFSFGLVTLFNLAEDVEEAIASLGALLEQLRLRLETTA